MSTVLTRSASRLQPVMHPRNDMRFYIERVEASRNFANKLWNAARFVLMNLLDDMAEVKTLPDDLNPEDKWIVSKLNSLIKEVTDNLENFELVLLFKNCMILFGMSFAIGI